MPSVDISMRKSLRPPAWGKIRDALARGVEQELSHRSIVQDAQYKITDVKTAFSSWDNCMRASFCKWPVIVIIVVGSLIVFSVLWCIIRCCCCGVSCCCSCFSCLKCFGDCCGCFDPPRVCKKKHLDEPYIPADHGKHYHTQLPMQTAPPVPRKFQPPQYAEFDAPKKVNDDALPKMPTWEESATRKVLVPEEVELSHLKKSSTLDQTRQRTDARSASTVSAMSTMSVNHNDQFRRGLPGSSGEQMSYHGQQELSPNQQATRYGQLGSGLRAGPYAARDLENRQNYSADLEPEGFGLDEPYDEPSHMSSTPMHGRSDQRTRLHDAPAQRNLEHLPNQLYGTAALGGPGAYMVLPHQTAVGPPHSLPYSASMERRENSSSLDNRQLYGPQAIMGVATASGGRQSPAPAQSQAYRRNPYGREQVHEQVAEMPAIPYEPSSDIPTAKNPQPAQTWPSEQSGPMELPGSILLETHVLEHPVPTHKETAVLDSPPLGMDPRVKRSPGPTEPPRPRSGSPYSHSSRGSPRMNQGHEISPPQTQRDDTNKRFSPAPPRQRAPGPELSLSPEPEQQGSPAPEHQRNRVPHLLARPMPSSDNSFGKSCPPQSPITNNAGFDFTSGYSRPRGNQSPGQSPTAAAYPGQRTYQPGR